jgi:hypothetical protein
MGMNNIGARSSLTKNMFWKVALPKELVFCKVSHCKKRVMITSVSFKVVTMFGHPLGC